MRQELTIKRAAPIMKEGGINTLLLMEDEQSIDIVNSSDEMVELLSTIVISGDSVCVGALAAASESDEKEYTYPESILLA